ncbi:MAG: site-specific DNA-methyltransferase [Myxococcota bacterium]|nr:site-specific DNA-methyltransferase [Myxococcota bacterium]
MIALPPDRGSARLGYAGRRDTPESAPAPIQRARLVMGAASQADLVIHGDLLAAAGSLLDAGAAPARLAYLDPPFDTGRSWLARLHLRGPQHTRRQADLEVEAYRDQWTGDAYLGFLHARLRAARALLHPEGVLVLHCDARRSHHLRILCEEVFGPDRLLNEIVWLRRPGRANTGRRLDQVTDRLLVFANGKRPRIVLPRTRDTPRARAYIDKRFTGRETDGRRYMTAPISSPNPRENLRYVYKGHQPPPNGWAISREKMEAWDAAGRLHFVPGGRVYRKVYLEDYNGQPVPDLWTDIPVLNAMASERRGYPTQKPEALLARIVEMFTEPGDVVLDGFAGSGTAAAVARRLGRRIVAIDTAASAADQTWLRLAAIPGPGIVGADLGDPAPPPPGAYARVAQNKGLCRLDPPCLPDLVEALSQRGRTPRTPWALIAAVAVGTRDANTLHVNHLAAPRDAAALVETQWPAKLGTHARLWDLRHRAFDAGG